MEIFSWENDVKNMNPRLASAYQLIVYAFMQQCDDVETIYQSILNLPQKRKGAYSPANYEETVFFTFNGPKMA